MKELYNYIFIDITEIVIKHFKRSKFLTFSSYCVNYGLAIKDGKTPSGDKYLLTELYDYLKVVYCLTNEEVGECLGEYFSLEPEKIAAIQRCASSLKYYYPYSYR